MSRSGGTYTAPTSSFNPAVEGTVIDESDFNTLLDDVEAALTESVYTGGLGSTDNVLLRTDGTDTKKAQGSALVCDDSGNLSGVGALSATSIQLGHASDTTIARAAAGRATIESVAVMRGPGSATDNTLPRFDGTTGDLLQTSGVVVDDSNNLTANTLLSLVSGDNYPLLSLKRASASSFTDREWQMLVTSTGKLGFYDVTGTKIRAELGTDNSFGTLDTDSSHMIRLKWGTNVTADRDITVTMPDVNTPLNLINPPRGTFGYGANRFYAGDLATLGSPTTLAISANILYAVPFAIGKRETWTRIGIDVTATAVGNARLGIYAADGTNGLPGTLTLDAGTVSVDTSTGTKEVTISQALNPGFYWLAVVSNVTPTIRATVNTNAAFSCAMGLAAIGTADTQYSIAHAYAALPNPFGAGSFAAASTPLMLLRVV